MKKNPTQVAGILKASGSVSVDGIRYNPTQLAGLAKIAQASGAHITVRNADRFNPTQLAGIAAAGPRSVTFVLDSD